MSHFLICGAAGFIGSHLCDQLIQNGHTVTGVDNFITGSKENLDHLQHQPQFHLIEADVTTSGLRQKLPAERFDAVFHLASLASPVDYYRHPIATLLSGSSATHQLLDIALENNARFLLTSTSEVYGDPLVHPQREDYWGNVNPIGLRSCYDESKRYAEAATMAYHRIHGLKTSIARIFNTYGPRMQLNDGRVVPAFMDQALRGAPLTVFGDGNQTRSFCYVSDLVDGLIRLAESDCSDPINLGNPDEKSMIEFAQIIKKLTGSTSSIEYRALPQDDPKRRKPDITKARQILGWEPRISLEEGLRKSIEYFSSVIAV